MNTHESGSASVGSTSQSKATFKLNAPQATDEAIDDNNSYTDMQEQLEKQQSMNSYGNTQTLPTHTQAIPNMGIGHAPDETAGARGAKSDDDDDDDSSSDSSRKKLPLKCMIVSGVVAIVLLVGLIAVVAVALSNQDPDPNPSTGGSTPAPVSPDGSTPGGSPTRPPNNEPTPVPQNHLGRIKLIGTLKCGVPIDQPGFAIVNATTGRMEGFDADLVRLRDPVFVVIFASFIDSFCCCFFRT